MKYLKMLALTAVAAGAFMAFIGAGTASATVLCSTTSTPCNSKWPVNTVIDFSLEPGTSANLVSTENEPLDTCTASTVKGALTNPGSATETPSGPIEELTWGTGSTKCTFTTDTTLFGGLEVHQDKNAKGELTHDGVVTSTGETKVTINTVLFGSCVYGVKAGVTLGTLTATNAEHTAATFDANAVAERLSGSSLVCPATSKWTAAYILTSPENTDLYVEPS